MTSYPYQSLFYFMSLNLADLGRGGRAMGGRAFGETLKRRVGLDVFFAPYVAKCFFLFPVSIFNLLNQKDFPNKHLNILLI